MEEYFNISNDYFDKYEKWETPELDNAAGYICLYYPIEASVWYWASLDTKCATFDDQGNQTNYAINDYIVHYDNLDANMDNVFLAVEYNLNGRQNFNKGDIDSICRSMESVWKEKQEFMEINGTTSNLPNGWTERVADWNNARELLEGERCL